MSESQKQGHTHNPDTDDDIIQSPDEFRIPASDAQGHSSRVWTRIQPGHDRQLDVVANCGWFPYRTKGDVVRHAVKRHLDWLETLAAIPSVMKQVDAILAIMREEEANEDFRLVFDSLGVRVAKFLTEGKIDRARSLVSQVASHIDDMPEGYWRDQYKEELKSRFGYMLKVDSQRPPANLLELVTDSEGEED